MKRCRNIHLVYHRHIQGSSKKIVLMVTVMVIGLLYFVTKQVIIQRQSVLAVIATPTQVQFPTNYTIASYLWKSPYKMSVKEQNNLLEFAHQAHINEIYTSIDDYIDLYELPNSLTKQLELTKFTNRMVSFVKKAQKEKIQIQALTGNPNWVNDSDSYIPPIMLSYVQNFNANYATESAHIGGIQYDIEFYNQTGFSNNSIQSTQSFLRLVDTLVKQVNSNSNPIQLGFAVPYWFGNQTSPVPIITWNNQAASVGQLLINSLTQNANTYLVNMAYRNTTEGPNGQIAIAKPLMVEAAKSSVKMLIGIETSQNADNSITFFNQTKQAVILASDNIVAAYSGNIAFNGIAIHHLQSFQQLADQ